MTIHETLMSEISLLQSTLKSHLPWHGARLNFLAQLLIALFRVKTVNLALDCLCVRRTGTTRLSLQTAATVFPALRGGLRPCR